MEEGTRLKGKNTFSYKKGEETVVKSDPLKEKGAKGAPSEGSASQMGEALEEAVQIDG